MRTKNDLATRVARRLRLIDIGEDAPPAEEAALIRETYDDKLEQWRENGLVYWTNSGNATAEIPAVVFPTLVNLVANWLSTEFKGAGITEVLAAEQALLIELRRHMAKAPSGEPAGFVDF